MNNAEIQERLEKYYDGWKEKDQIVTVFMLTHKRPYYLSLAIESVLKQTYSNFYLIVVDNMSGDETPSVVEKLNDGRVIYVERDGTQENDNWEFAFNTSKTKYIIVLHDDDIVEPVYLENMVEAMEANPNISAMSAAACLIDPEGNTINRDYSFDNTIRVFGPSEYTRLRITENANDFLFVFPSVIYRNSFYNFSLKGFDDTKNAGPAGDLIIYFQTERRGGTLAMYQKKLINYRIHPNQESIIHGGRMELQLLKYLYNNEYYRQFVDDGVIYSIIKPAFHSCLKNLTDKTYGKKDMKRAYSLLEKGYLTNFKVRLLHFEFKLSTVFTETTRAICTLLFKGKKMLKR